MATSPQRPPLYNGHLFTTATFFADSPYIDSCLNLFSLQWPVSSVPKVAAVEQFSCKKFLSLNQKKLNSFWIPYSTL